MKTARKKIFVLNKIKRKLNVSELNFNKVS